MHTSRHILSLLMLFAATFVVAQPRFVPDNEILKVGEVAFRQPKTFTLPFANKGNEPLVIQSVHASCGCLQVKYSNAPIEPGARGELQLTFDAKMLGSFYKEVELVTNASDQPQYMAIQGYVVAELTDYSDDFPIDLGNVRLQTNCLLFDDVNKGDKPVAELRLVNMERTAFTPQLMHLPAFLSAECTPDVIPPGKMGTLRVQLDSEKLPMMGLNQTSIYLSRYMGDKISAANEIAVSAVLLPDFSGLSAADLAHAPELYVTEPEVTLTLGGKKPKLKQSVLLINMGQRPLHIRQVQVFSRGLSVSVGNRTLQPGKSTKLRVAIQPNSLKDDKNLPRILLISDDPARPKQTIEVHVE